MSTSGKILLNYDPESLKKSADRRKKHISAFEEVIKKETAYIEHYTYILNKIDPDHPDIKKLKSSIIKKKGNIRTFKKAIQDEKKLIRKELDLAKNLIPDP